MPLAASLALTAVLGAFTWSFLEYVIHRWLGHDARFRPNLFESEHTRHHGRGNYFAPTWKKALATVIVFCVATPLAMLVARPSVGVAWAAGLAGFYAFYEVVHRRAHTHAPVGPYGAWLRRHHFWHHFGNPRTNHGVTSPLWDHVFGTWAAPEQIRVPVKLAMPWLVTEDGDRVRDEYAGSYQLRGRA